MNEYFNGKLRLVALSCASSRTEGVALVGGFVAGLVAGTYRRFSGASTEVLSVRVQPTGEEEQVTKSHVIGGDFYSGDVDEEFNLDDTEANKLVQMAKDLNMTAQEMAEVVGHPSVASPKPNLTVVPDPEELEETNIFELVTQADDNWDWTEQSKFREDNDVYPIHQTEYFADEEGFTQSTLTYYEDDDVMTDDRDGVIYNHGQVVGELLFGVGTNDKNVFYVRNEGLGAEYEVLLHHSSYAEEVLGLEVEEDYEAGDLKHSATRFREE